MSTPGNKEEGSGTGKMWGMVLILIVLVFSGVLSGLAEQLSRFITLIFGSITNSIGNFFMMLMVNKSAIFLTLAAVWLVRLMRKKKDPEPPKKNAGGGHPPAAH